MTPKFPIYMDYQATTPVDPRVLDEMLPYFSQKFGNPHSRTHIFGWEAEEAVEKAREHIAALINADPSEVIFTSGATESNNLALKGVAKFNRNDNKNHIVTVLTEHKCVLDTCKHLEQEGFNVTYLSVNSDGMVNISDLEKAISDYTSVVSIMAINNEIGVIQQLSDIGAICRDKKVFFHTDAAQAFGKIPLDVKAMKVDLMSISGHKIYGPKGIGALYVGKQPRVRIIPIINGGGQERGMRSGTVPTPLVVGLGAAAKYALQDMESDYKRIKQLSDQFSESLLSIPEVYLNGSKVHHYPGCLNFNFAYIEGESMMGAVSQVAVSSGSACTSASLEPSYVLKALGVDEDLSHTSIRFGFGRFTTLEEVEYVIEVIKNAVTKLRTLSPLWEMAQQGIDLKSMQWVKH